MRLPPIKLHRWFHHPHYEWHVLGGAVVALVVLKLSVTYFGLSP